MSEQERTLRAVYDAWNSDDLEAYLATLHPEVEIRPVLGRNLEVDLYCGHAGALRWHEDAKGEWDRLESLVTEVAERGDRAITTVQIRGRGRASGVRIEAEIYHVGVFREGLLISIEGFTERAEALQALESS